MTRFVSFFRHSFDLLLRRWSRVPKSGREMILVGALGMGVGVIAVGFHAVVERIHHFTIGMLAGVNPTRQSDGVNPTGSNLYF
ncbi:MAG: hypothetical protein LBK99_14530 [Opitutaceae bacterium]|jgi:CIC family chloride channel protein|nr:hypothetical protein [Opitutaceae bacterium]